MAYEYPIDVTDLWRERAPQFVNLGIPKAEVDRLVEAVDDMWKDAPGGWCYEWSQLASRYADAGQSKLAAIAYGGARFPCLADEAKALAHQRQIEQYVLAAKDFPVGLERRRVTAHLNGEPVEVPVHILSAPDATEATPVLVVTGGVDTWKIDLHNMWEHYVLHTGVRVVACDIPGTGELTHIPLTRGSTEIVDGVVAFARTLTGGKVGQLGMSFGGYFSAHAGLTEVVDAAVVVGGPVAQSFTREHLHALLFGMKDIVGNACGFTMPPSADQLLEVAMRLRLDDLLAKDVNCPMFVINGDKDVHVPLADTTVFQGRRHTTVQLVPGAGHCAFDEFDQLLVACTRWLSSVMHEVPVTVGANG
jgi:esterase FrsA